VNRILRFLPQRTGTRTVLDAHRSGRYRLASAANVFVVPFAAQHEASFRCRASIDFSFVPEELALSRGGPDMTTQHSTVKWFDAKKGYGFINHPDGGNDIFIHYSQIESDDDFKTLRTGQSVQFEMNDGPKGLHAVSVKALDDGQSSTDSDDSTDPAAQSSTQPTASSPREEGRAPKASAGAAPDPAFGESPSYEQEGYGTADYDDPEYDGLDYDEGAV